MTDQDNENHQDPETSEVDRAVRALLGAARVDEPMPADVTDRLEEALAGAARGPDGATRLRVVRMRRRLAGGLVAAAVVVVGGGALVAQLDDSNNSATDSTNAGSAAAGSGGSVEGSAPNLSRLPAATPKAAAGDSPLPGRVNLPQVRSAHFASDVGRLVQDTPYATKAKRKPTDSLNLAQAEADCSLPPGAGKDADVREISLDGSLAMLLVDPPDAQPRRATAYSCDGGHELASTELSR